MMTFINWDILSYLHETEKYELRRVQPTKWDTTDTQNQHMDMASCTWGITSLVASDKASQRSM